MNTPKAKGSPRASKPRKTATKSKPPSKAGARAKPGASDAVVLLSGGNPQIAKADGDASVQADIAAMPGWTQDVGRRLDALIVPLRPHRPCLGQLADPAESRGRSPTAEGPLVRPWR